MGLWYQRKKDEWHRRVVTMCLITSRLNYVVKPCGCSVEGKTKLFSMAIQFYHSLLFIIVNYFVFRWSQGQTILIYCHVWGINCLGRSMAIFMSLKSDFYTLYSCCLATKEANWLPQKFPSFWAFFLHMFNSLWLASPLVMTVTNSLFQYNILLLFWAFFLWMLNTSNGRTITSAREW